MREKYETLSLAVLRELAKARELKGVTGLKKADLIDRMVAEDEKLKGQNEQTSQDGQEQGTKTQPQQETAKTEPSGQGAAARADRTENRAERADSRPENRSDRTDSRPENRSDRTDSRMENRSDKQDSHQNQNQAREMRPRRPDGEGRDDINSELDSGVTADGILEVMPDGYGFIRCENYLPGEHDVYVSPSQIRRFGLKTGDIVRGNTRIKTQGEKFSALLYITTINGYHPSVVAQRRNFEDLTPIFPNERLRLETNRTTTSMRIVDLVSPIGKGQRGMIVSPPKAGKTTLLKQIAQAVKVNNPEIHLIILLIDERPEEVTDIKEAIEGENVEVIYSTFDELPEHHKRVSEMVIERAKRLVEHKHDVLILLDSITRLARAYNLTVPPSGRTLSGGLDPAALHMPKRFFGAARNMREGGSLTVLASALVDTGSKMDDVIYEEFKGTGNMELVLDRKLSEKRVFPAIDIVKSGTRREDLLLDREEREAVDIMRKGINGMKTDEAVENILNMFARTGNNRDFIQVIKKRRV
ncbi:MAG: transcription termination factor Rho [Eubacterium sp.]|jgi:transcription termination factor Rho|nr:transcription termination factor Rho [Eubacterium sp.]